MKVVQVLLINCSKKTTYSDRTVSTQQLTDKKLK